IANIPYEDYFRNKNEFWYRSLFIILLRGAGIVSYSEPHTSKGRADVVLQFNNLVVVLEFKFAKTAAEVEQMKRKGLQQIHQRAYAEGYNTEGREVVCAVLIADDANKQLIAVQ
ncbi:MAG: PD-(D/E)XK nuclease domain-containing protein, partial [Synergistaceae bacterium]|nr:PD-(D/E)XK nuclease domain-containing protein [Synergistaceae bacterium]